MSVGIATMGMFSPCCKTEGGGGGAPPYRQEEQEKIIPLVLVKRFEMLDCDITDKMFKNISVKLLDEED